MNVNAVDDFLSEENFEFVLRYCREATYLYGEVDDIDPKKSGVEYVTGMVHQIYPVHHFESDSNPINLESRTKMLELIHNECISQFPVLNDFDLRRLYVNCFAPRENPYFHIDTPPGIRQSYTCLFYANSSWDLDDGGETQFYINDIIYGVAPIPNRMVLFDGGIQHRATSFRNKHRFSIALKYYNDDFVVPPS